MKIGIAGATGFIGRRMIEQILASTDHEIVAFSRRQRDSENPRIRWVKVDLYSLKETVDALAGCDVGVYLVHSMAPNARLAQGTFRDFDYLLADNFSRAARAHNCRHILYIGGILPQVDQLSVHLESRREVEEVLRHSGIPVTTLRCGMVIGPNGSSYKIMVKLVESLPVMILPKWMRTKSSPIYLDDLVTIVMAAIDEPPSEHRVIDAGMSDCVNYKDMVQATARVLGRKPILFDVANVSPGLSKLWVRLISGAPKGLVYPLIDSVKHEMVIDESHAIPEHWNIKLRSLDEAVRLSLAAKSDGYRRPRKPPPIAVLSEVRSVQRMAVPEDMSAADIAAAYMRWLPIYLRPFLRVQKTENFCRYYLRGFNTMLLELQFRSEVDDRSLFIVEHGLLVDPGSRGRFEFRKSHDDRFVIVALHSFRPSLPWAIYRFTQAVVHEWVMRSFSNLLQKVGDLKR